MSVGLSRRAPIPLGAAVPSLARWGLTSDADLVFRTITSIGPRTARELARELGLPARRMDDALAELHEVDAVVAIPDGRSRAHTPVWRAQPSAEVVAALRARRSRPVDREAQARSHQAVVSALAEHVGAAVAAFAAPPIRGQFGEGVRYLPTRVLTRQRLAELTVVQRREHLAINTEQAFEAEAARAAAPLGRQLVERGVRVRVLGLPPADRDLHVDPGLFDSPSLAYRETPTTPMKLIVVDRKFAFFPVDPDDFERGYLEISQPGVVRALVYLFEQHWATATDPRECGVPQIVLTDRERQLIALLAGGCTDLEAAAHLRISARSVTNIMRTLMDRFGVDNRFQLGLALGAARVASPHPAPPASSTEEE